MIPDAVTRPRLHDRPKPRPGQRPGRARGAVGHHAIIEEKMRLDGFGLQACGQGAGPGLGRKIKVVAQVKPGLARRAIAVMAAHGGKRPDPHLFGPVKRVATGLGAQIGDQRAQGALPLPAELQPGELSAGHVAGGIRWVLGRVQRHQAKAERRVE